MSRKPFFGNWMVAIAEAADVAGSSDLDTASADELTKAWDLVSEAASISRDDLAERVAAQAGVAIADFLSVDPHAARLVPAEVARRRNIMPVRCTDRELVIATANPLSQDTKREIAGLASRTVTFEIAPPVDIELAILKGYGRASADDELGASPADRVKPGGPHVLVVDDEAGARALFRSVLEEGGFRVSLARNGQEALEILEGEHSFDLVTLDYWMDKMNGLRVLQLMRAQPRLKSVPVIMVTGADDRRIEMSVFEAGADDFIVKPIDAPLFILRIQAALRRRLLR